MLNLIGNYSLVFALVVALPLLFFSFKNFKYNNSLEFNIFSLIALQSFFILLSFIILLFAFVKSDFSNLAVYYNSHTTKPLFYKISGTWGNHEGSLLLWLLVLSLFTIIFFIKTKKILNSFRCLTIFFQQIIILGFLLFIIFTSNPFQLIQPIPNEGLGLNPILQDPALAIHPPILYLGYVGSSIIFSSSLAALVCNYVNKDWAGDVKKWTLISWVFLTVGIMLGSIWAYYELGWGGFWFWDPVENASFMPWLAATALVHSLSVTENRGTFKSWTVLLAITAFSFSLLGAFIVRSGVLTSVHSFAVDPERGMYILIFLALVVGGSLALYAARAGQNTAKVGYELLSREFFMLINNVILVVSLAVVLWGTLAPIGYEALSGGRISIGTPFFNAFFVPLGLLLLGALAWLPVLNWKRTRVEVFTSVYQALGIAGVLGGLVWFALDPASLLVAGAVALALWVLLTHGRQLWLRWRKGSVPAAYLGMTLAHVGFALGTVGIAITSTQSVESDVRMTPQSSMELAGKQLIFNGIVEVQGPNYAAKQGLFEVIDGERRYTLRPEKRQYFAGGNTMTEAAIAPGLFADTYVSLGEPLEGDAWAVRAHYKPLVRWVWLGALLMAFGGVLAVFDKRYVRQRRRLQAPNAESVTA